MISPLLSPVTREASDMSTDHEREQQQLQQAVKKAHEIAKVMQEQKEKSEIWSFWRTKVCPKCSHQLFSLIIYNDRTHYECDSCAWECTLSAVERDQIAPGLK